MDSFGPLTEREKNVLQLLLENKVMTRQQIAAQVFPALDSGNLSNRLKRILKLGLVRDYMDRQLDRRAIFYELSNNGVSYAKSIHSLEFDQSPARSYCYGHDAGLVTIRQLFQSKSSVKEYIPENILQCCPVIREDDRFAPFALMMSDAVIGLQQPDGMRTGAVEYESTKKAIDRYRDKVLYYYVREKIRFVLYVCKDETIARAIKSIENEIKPEGATKIYFALINDVLLATDKVTFVNRNQAVMEIT